MKRFITNQGIIQIFGSLLLVITFMFVSNYFVYQNSISSIYEKVAENNTLAVKSMMKSYDDSFRTINNIMYAIHGLPFNDLESDEAGRIDMTKVYMMQDNIATLVSSIDFIEDVIVFYNDHDIAITAKGTSSLDHVFNQKYKGTHDASYWRNYMRSKNTFTIFAGEYYKITTQTFQQKKKLMLAVDGNKIRLSNKNIILLIDESALMKNANQNLMIPGASMIIMDQNRNVILSTDSNTDIKGMLDDIYFNSSKESSLTKENYEYHFFKSDFNGYIYIDKVPYQFNNIDSVSRANRMMMVTTIVCSIVLSIFLSIFLNRPVKRILKQLGRGQTIGNDFRKIHGDIVQMQNEIDSYKKQLKTIESEARRGIFLQALDEYSHSSELDLQIQNYCADFFHSKQFVLVMFHLSMKSNEHGPMMPIDRISEIIQASLSGMNASLFYERQLQFIAIVNMNQVSERETLLKHLKAHLTRMENDELAGYSIKASVSKLYASEMANIKYAYRNVMNGMLYRSVNEASNVLDMMKIQYEWSVYFPFEKIEKLSNYVTVGKLKEVKEIIAETIKENADRDIHHHQLTHIAKTIFFYLVKHAGAEANTNNELYHLEQQFMYKVDHAYNYTVIEDALIEAAKYIAKHSKPEQASKLNPAFISQYIELHYMENLYLDDIAAVTETSPKYFSSYFKKTFGINYIEYLNKVRLSHARELLKDTTYTVAEIGEKTGYLNSSTFSTTFRKFFGISPTDYRKQHMS